MSDTYLIQGVDIITEKEFKSDEPNITFILLKYNEQIRLIFYLYYNMKLNEFNITANNNSLYINPHSPFNIPNFYAYDSQLLIHILNLHRDELILFKNPFDLFHSSHSDNNGISLSVKYLLLMPIYISADVFTNIVNNDGDKNIDTKNFDVSNMKIIKLSLPDTKYKIKIFVDNKYNTNLNINKCFNVLIKIQKNYKVKYRNKLAYYINKVISVSDIFNLIIKYSLR